MFNLNTECIFKQDWWVSRYSLIFMCDKIFIKRAYDNTICFFFFLFFFNPSQIKSVCMPPILLFSQISINRTAEWCFTQIIFTLLRYFDGKWNALIFSMLCMAMAIVSRTSLWYFFGNHVEKKLKIVVLWLNRKLIHRMMLVNEWMNQSSDQN